MATYAENLATIRDQITARIIEVTASANPDYSVDGQSVSKAGYLATLTSQLESINKALQMADGGFEIRSRGVT